MAVFRVEKNSGYTVMSNHHLRNRALSLKAKGLLSQMLSLPEDWDYTLQGLARINRESIDAIRQAIRELEQAGYIQRSRERDEKGRLRGADYVIFELPQPVPASVSPTLENPTLENPTQENPMPEGLTVHRLIPLFKDWNEVQTRRGEITDGKYLREAVYGLKEPPQEETVEIIRMSEVDTQTVEWLWEPYIPFGKVTIVQGNPGEGKTTFALRLAAACTTGGTLPGMKPIQPFQVIYQTAEDGLGDTVKPRLIEAAADLDRVLVIDEAKRELTLSDERIEKAIVQNGARLIILDPIQAYMGEKTDMNRANEVRPMFRRLADVAERTGCAVILIGHLNKAAGGQSAYRGLGSIDFRAAARSVLLIGRVKREPNVRVIIHDKSSLAPEGKPVAFCLDPETGFEWIGEYDITADELLSGAGGNNATKTEQAEKLILDLLADGKELASEDIEKAAADAGISARTVRAAKKNLDGRITSKRIGAAWYHALKK